MYMSVIQPRLTSVSRASTRVVLQSTRAFSFILISCSCLFIIHVNFLLLTGDLYLICILPVNLSFITLTCSYSFIIHVNFLICILPVNLSSITLTFSCLLYYTSSVNFLLPHLHITCQSVHHFYMLLFILLAIRCHF